MKEVLRSNQIAVKGSLPYRNVENGDWKLIQHPDSRKYTGEILVIGPRPATQRVDFPTPLSRVHFNLNLRPF
ncbi:hypothetical protein [Dyadobacter jiangsuensis]|uniref:Uncharacterized protein n=1 Tax=Dyadobacter jiangsuensis TaxID=1591085 RepID=A0A2P8GJ71_9BACT|nr:hypothetical protein [Dyadobacter jiangsuensis]PSL34014.1 hypothetical protein CLV60_101383 [Dyadobacter jiangsuensis]